MGMGQRPFYSEWNGFSKYIGFVENIKDNYEKQLESGLKCLNKCRFYTLANNRSWWANTLEYEINS